jgi:hypothetical protein
VTRYSCLIALLLPFSSAGGQSTSADSKVHLSAGAGVLTSGAYFTGPGDIEVASGTAAAALAQVSVAVHPRVALVFSGLYARPEWELSGVPLAGTIGVSGASLWFADAGVRGWLPIGGAPGGTAAFAALGAGAARYALNTSVLGVAVDEQATNFTVSVGAGLSIPLASRVGLELMAKDYVASFRSVRDLAQFGVEGKRAHTFVFLASARVGL